MLCTTSVGAPRSRTTFWNSSSTAADRWHRRRNAHAVRLLQLQHRFVRIPCRDGDTHAVFANSLAQLELMPGPPPMRSQRPVRKAGCRVGRTDSCSVLPQCTSLVGGVRSAKFRRREQRRAAGPFEFQRPSRPRAQIGEAIADGPRGRRRVSKLRTRRAGSFSTISATTAGPSAASMTSLSVLRKDARTS